MNYPVIHACIGMRYLLKKFQNKAVLIGYLMMLAGLIISIDFNFDKDK